MVLGPKYHSYYSIWALKPYSLGPWTLRDRVKGIKNRQSSLSRLAGTKFGKS